MAPSELAPVPLSKRGAAVACLLLLMGAPAPVRAGQAPAGQVEFPAAESPSTVSPTVAGPRALTELLGATRIPDLRASFDDGWRWRVFDTESGLPSNSVYDVVETPAGSIWVATQSGIAWFDDYRWTALDERHGVPAQRPRSIAAHGRDQLLAVFGRRLFRGDRNGFEQIAVQVEGTPFDALLARSAGAESAFVVAATDPTSAATVLSYDGERFDRLQPVVEAQWDQEAIAGWSNGDGAFWWASGNALQRWQDGAWQTKLVSPGARWINVERLVETPDGSGLLKIRSPASLQGLWEWRDGGELMRNEGERTDLLEAMDVSPGGDALLVFRSGDVRVRENGRWSGVQRVPSHLTGLLFVEFRDNGDLWVGTQRGLFLLRASLTRWQHWEVPSPDARNEILEILPADDGSLWLATGRGVAVHRPDGSVEWIERVGEVELREVTALAQDQDGGIWIGSGSGLDGAYRWDGESWQHFGADQGLHAPLVHKIRADRRGRLWFLGMAPLIGETVSDDDPGAFVLQDGRFTPWTTAEGMLHGRVYDFAEAADGTLWFATFSGLSRWRAGAWTHWTTTEGLRRARTFTVAVDRDGRAWFGDQLNGLGYIDELDRPRYLTSADGLVNNEVQEVRVGSNGELWITTRGGLSCLHEGNWVNFDVTTGLSSPILWPVVPRDDRVLVGTSGNGVDVLSLEEADLPPPRIDFEPPIIDESSVFLRWTAHAYWGQLAPEAIPTRHRIDGGSWSAWSRQRETLLAALPAGEHVIEVQARGLLGAASATPSRATFSVRPPLHLRRAFLVPTGALVLVVLALLASRLRHSDALRRRDEDYRRRLEERVDERTEALRESEERLRMLLESAHVIPWVADAVTWEFTYVGPQAVEVLGYPLERWYEDDFWQRHIHPDDVEEALSFCSRQLSVSDRYDFEYRMIAADGRTVWLHDLVAVVREGGVPATLRGFMIDVTARKRAEAERLAAETEALEHRERLAHLSRVNMLGEMATGIAHEVNQPLTAVSTYTQACRRMIRAGLIDTDGIIDVLGRISDEAVRAGDMIHGLKALVRKRRSELRVCNVNQLVRDVLPLAEVEARAIGVTLELELRDDLPEVVADDVQVQQVVLNLLRNAVEAAPPEGGVVRVVSRLRADGLIEVEVADNGSGLDAEDPDKIFQPFFSTKQEGMGMGLSISRSIIDAHGGEIGYRPRAEGGSVFYFRLPSEPAAAAEVAHG